jgi:hypothetical protein
VTKDHCCQLNPHPAPAIISSTIVKHEFSSCFRRGLLKSCWQQNPKLRTRASEMVEFLANNPRLLVPCLEVPLASVQLEDTNQLEFNLPGQFRKFSGSNIMKPSLTVPNGIAGSRSLDGKLETRRQESASDSGISIPLENCCPREPLLGPSKSSSSLLNFGKHVGFQHRNEDDEDAAREATKTISRTTRPPPTAT